MSSSGGSSAIASGNAVAAGSKASSKPSGPIGPVLNRPMDDVKNYYTIGKELGRGQFGVSHLCTEKSTGM